MTGGRRGGRPGIVAGALVACIAVAVAGLGAARVPSSARDSLCLPLLASCDSSSPSPSPSPSGGSGTPVLPGVPVPGLGAPVPAPALGSPSPSTAPSAPPAPGGPNPGTTVFTEPPAQLGSDSISFSGLKGVSVVTVPLIDGRRVSVLKISADSITIEGFSLTVRKATGASLATTADQMALQGNVQVYLDSATATGSDGKSLTLGAATPPPQDGVPTQLLRVTLGLVGVTADQITFTNPHQHLSDQ